MLPQEPSWFHDAEEPAPPSSYRRFFQPFHGQMIKLHIIKRKGMMSSSQRGGPFLFVTVSKREKLYMRWLKPVSPVWTRTIGCLPSPLAIPLRMSTSSNVGGKGAAESCP